jgi:chemotaxis protein methyltransferase CheR
VRFGGFPTQEARPSGDTLGMHRESSATTEPLRQREFPFTDADFAALRTLVKQLTGIHLADSKREMVYGRVSRRLRALGLRTFGDYRRRLEEDGSCELTEFCNAMTTNLTAFFREAHHFEYLRDQFLRPHAADPRASRRVRIWSAACSSGEEPYSIAMTVCEAIPDWKRWDVKILATDIDSDILARARRGVYLADRVKGLDPRRLERFFRPRVDGGQRAYEVGPDLAALVTFKPINLMHELPMKGPLDAVLCRNVIIYFDKESQRALFARVAKLQRPDDLLFLGHSESLFKVSGDYTLIGKTIYRRN